MKIENIEKAAELAAEWKTVRAMETYLRSNPSLRNLGFMGKGGAMGLADLMVVFKGGEVQDCIVDGLKELMDRRVSTLLGQLKELGVDTETMAVEREALLNKEV